METKLHRRSVETVPIIFTCRPILKKQRRVLGVRQQIVLWSMYRGQGSQTFPAEVLY